MGGPGTPVEGLHHRVFSHCGPGVGGATGPASTPFCAGPVCVDSTPQCGVSHSHPQRGMETCSLRVVDGTTTIEKTTRLSLPAGSFLFGAYPRSARWMPTITALTASAPPPSAKAITSIASSPPPPARPDGRRSGMSRELGCAGVAAASPGGRSTPPTLGAAAVRGRCARSPSSGRCTRPAPTREVGY